MYLLSGALALVARRSRCAATTPRGVLLLPTLSQPGFRGDARDIAML
jgi:hypothetical protein